MQGNTERALDLAEHLPARVLRRGIFEAELPYVWTSLKRLGVASRDLEDVAHELFLQVLKRLRECDTSLPVRPWLFAFAVRFASDYRRLARHKVDLRSASTPRRSAPSHRSSSR